MITNILFGNPITSQRLGNQLFQLASMLGLAYRFNTTVAIPASWTYAPFFNLSPRIKIMRPHINLYLQEPSFSYSGKYFDSMHKEMQEKVVNINGFLQSEKYWKEFETEIRENLSFTKIVSEFIDSAIEEYGCDVDKVVAISVRRGDFITDPNHYLLEADYYISAYRKYFNDMEAFFFSDDIEWCRKVFQGIAPKTYYADGLNSIEQLSLMSCFKKFIIANSTFSWWGAYLSNSNGKIIVRPEKHFDGELLKLDISDHYPPEWIAN